MNKSLVPELFDYGLDATQEKRAQRLHKESLIIDLYCSGPTGAAAFTEDMIKQIKADYEKDHNAGRNFFMAKFLPLRMAARGEFPAFKEWWDASGVTASKFTIPLDFSLREAMGLLAATTLMFDHFDWIIKALHADDIRRAKAEGKHARFINSQNTVAIGLDLDNLDMLHEFGMNMVLLTYNTMNFVGAGCTERTDVGISNYGVKFIERMNKLGIIVDTAHCGNQTTLDACEISKQPVVASHTAARGVYYHARSKTDEAIKAIAKTGGVVGVLTLPYFLSDAAEVTIERFLDHIDYIVKLVGHKHVCVGTDGPVSAPEWTDQMVAEKIAPMMGFRPEDKIRHATLKGFKDYCEFINITRGLVSRGYSDDQIRDILGGNCLRVMEAVWK